MTDPPSQVETRTRAIRVRWWTLKQGKHDFGQIVEKAGLPRASAEKTPAKR